MTFTSSSGFFLFGLLAGAFSLWLLRSSLEFVIHSSIPALTASLLRMLRMFCLVAALAWTASVSIYALLFFAAGLIAGRFMLLILYLRKGV